MELGDTSQRLAPVGKELKLVEAGRLTAQPLDEVISEMRAKHGSKRVGAGRKTTNPKIYTIRVSLQEKR